MSVIGRSIALLTLAAAAACKSDVVEPVDAPETLQFSTAQIHALDSTGTVIVQANPTDATIKSIVDSTLEAISAGVVAKRLDVTTNFTSKPLYFVAIHRVVSRASGSFSTWNLVGMDDPAHLTRLLAVSGFASSTNATVPTSVTGQIGTGLVNAHMIEVGTGGAITQFHASSGTVTFTSGTTTGACPNWTPPNANLSCALETIRVSFTANAGTRQASVTEVDVPAMRITYTGP